MYLLTSMCFQLTLYFCTLLVPMHLILLIVHKKSRIHSPLCTLDIGLHTHILLLPLMVQLSSRVLFILILAFSWTFDQMGYGLYNSAIILLCGSCLSIGMVSLVSTTFSDVSSPSTPWSYMSIQVQ